LNLDPTGALRDDLDFSFAKGSAPQSDWVWGEYGDNLKDVFNESWLDYMESKNCLPRKILVFYKPPYYGDNVHVDVYPEAELVEGEFVHYTINFTANPGYMSGNGDHRKYKNWKDTGTMRWYNTHADNQSFDTLSAKTSNFEYEYTRMPESSCFTEIERVKFESNGIYLANVLTPHGIITTDQPRLTISLRHCLTGDFTSWEDVVAHFDDLGLIIN
jgi:hypothetical protein